MKLADHIAKAMKSVEEVIARCQKIQIARKADGRDISPDRYAELERMDIALSAVYNATTAMNDLLKRGPEQGEGSDEADLLLAEYTRVASKLGVS